MKLTVNIENINTFGELHASVNYTRLYDALEQLKRNFPEYRITITKEYKDGECSSQVIK